MSDRRVGEWRVGDVVVVSDKGVVTSLGEGSIVDLEVQRGTDAAVSALVRFDGGPVSGVWYSVGNLKQLRDLHGDPLPKAGYTLPKREDEPKERREARRTHTIYVGVPMSDDRIKELRDQANDQDAEPYDDAQAIHECLDVIVALQSRWKPPPPRSKAPSSYLPKALLLRTLEQEEDEAEEVGEATAESTVVAKPFVVECECKWRGPQSCPEHKFEPCDTANCEETGGVVCVCGIKACPTCTETIHVYCVEDGD